MELLHIEAFRFLNDLGKEYPSLNPLVLFFAEYMQFGLCAGMVFYWLTRTDKNRRMVLHAVLAFLLAEVIGKTAGLVYSHYQPFAELPNVNQLVAHAVDNSFPSDHSILFFSVCFTIWLTQRRKTWLWLVIACGVALSRVWVGVHYPIDVMAGALIGVFSAKLVVAIGPRLAILTKLLEAYERVERRMIPMRGEGRDVSRG
ncbi:MAG: undecaprenyl-diphosphatase [Clostridia bacterium]